MLTSSVDAAPVRTSVNSHRRSASDGNTIFYNQLNKDLSSRTGGGNAYNLNIDTAQHRYS